jgi:hypothetical protein
VSKDAKAAFAVAARIFVSYCTAMANEIAMESNRKTLNAMDVGGSFYTFHFPFSSFLTLLCFGVSSSTNELAGGLSETRTDQF